MEKLIYIKYGELTLKIGNRKNFTNILIKNIKKALNGYKYNIKTFYDCSFISDCEQIQEVVSILKMIPGIYSITTVFKISRDLLACAKIYGDIINKNNYIDWKIEVSRKDKSFEYTSTDYKKILGLKIQEYTKIKPLLSKPKHTLKLEILSDSFLVYENTYYGVGGLPVGSNGRCLVLISGGIDSPVASYLLMSRGLSVDFLTFITPPHTSKQALEKVKMLVDKITLNKKICSSNLYVCDYSNILHELNHIQKQDYKINLMRRSFLRIAEQFAINKKIYSIATGDALGQVASQTLDSLFTIGNVVNNCLLLRPLITYKKDDIIKIARNIGTYDISILPFADSCSLFAPKNPVINPKLNTSCELETKLEFLKELESITVNKIKNIDECE